MKPNSFLTAIAGAALAVVFAASAGAPHPAIGATPPPTPPPLAAPSSTPEQAPAPGVNPGSVATPVPVPSGFAVPGQPAPGASTAPTPPPNARKGIEGVWEVQIQRGSNTEYTHLVLKQDGSTISGTYVNSNGKKYPIAGSLDAQAVHLVVTLPDGTSISLEGRLDGTTDMIGEFTTPKEQVTFTAAYRPKSKFIDNLNAAPGGMGGNNSGGGGPP
ncbi:MAG TPA: hypothetical protein VGF98_03250 [Candidatus Tumulicola sp.]